MAQVISKLFKAILVFSDRATIYSDVIRLTAVEVWPTNVSKVSPPGNLGISCLCVGLLYGVRSSSSFLYVTLRAQRQSPVAVAMVDPMM